MPGSPATLLLLVLILTATATPLSATAIPRAGTSAWGDYRILYAPAVSRQGGGALIEINVSVRYPGSGRVYFNANPLVETDTQATARIAAYVAATITGRDFYHYDYYVDMTSNSIVVGGPSAGGLIAIGFISIFLNKTINSWVAMTGMINPDGSIGPVGGLPDKLRAVASTGYKVFLIPLGQRVVMVEKRVVKRLLWGYFETTEYRPVDIVEMGRELGVTVVEVGNILEAMKYFLNTTISTKTTAVSVPQAVDEKIRSMVEANTREIQQIYNDTIEIYNGLGYFEKWSAAGKINGLRAEIDRLQQLVEGGKYYAALDYSYKVLRDSYKAYFEVAVLSGKSISWITSLVNQTLQAFHEELANTTRSKDTVNALLAEKYSYLSLKYYIEGLRAAGRNNVEEALSKYSYSLSMLWRALQTAELSGAGDVEIRVDASTVFLYYGIADATVSYAYSLVNDIGSSNTYIDEAITCFNYAVDALKSNNTLATIGLLIDTIVYSDIGIETLFIDNQRVLEEITRFLYNETLLYSSRVGEDSPLNMYIIMGSEEKNTGDLISSMTSLLTYIYLTGLVNNTMTIQPIETIYPVGGGNSSSNTPLVELPSPTHRDLTFTAIGVVIGLVMGLLIARALSSRRKEYQPTIYWPI